MLCLLLQEGLQWKMPFVSASHLCKRHQVDCSSFNSPACSADVHSPACSADVHSCCCASPLTSLYKASSTSLAGELTAALRCLQVGSDLHGVLRCRAYSVWSDQLSFGGCCKLGRVEGNFGRAVLYGAREVRGLQRARYSVRTAHAQVILRTTKCAAVRGAVAAAWAGWSLYYDERAAPLRGNEKALVCFWMFAPLATRCVCGGRRLGGQ